MEQVDRGNNAKIFAKGLQGRNVYGVLKVFLDEKNYEAIVHAIDSAGRSVQMEIII